MTDFAEAVSVSNYLSASNLLLLLSINEQESGRSCAGSCMLQSHSAVCASNLEDVIPPSEALLKAFCTFCVRSRPGDRPRRSTCAGLLVKADVEGRPSQLPFCNASAWNGSSKARDEHRSLACSASPEQNGPGYQIAHKQPGGFACGEVLISERVERIFILQLWKGSTASDMDSGKRTARDWTKQVSCPSSIHLFPKPVLPFSPSPPLFSRQTPPEINISASSRATDTSLEED